MKIIGITGGVGSGKSRVLSYLEEKYGAVICQADHVAWDLQKPGEKCYQAIVEYFGTCILNADKTINRKKLGEFVFGNETPLSVLNAIMHPAVNEEIRKRIEIGKISQAKYFVIEAALLIEENYDEICDELWYIYTSEAVRRVRLKESRQYSDEKIDAIISAQLAEKVFRTSCQRVIDNSADFENTVAQIDDIMKLLGEN